MASSPSTTPRPTAADRTIVVVCGGDPLPPELIPVLHAEAARALLTIAADSGLDEAVRWEVAVDRLVGDLDSVHPDSLEQARAQGVPIDPYPRDKDRTDLAIALDTALGYGPDRIAIFGGAGGRLDHLLGNAALLAAEDYADVRIEGHLGAARVNVVRGIQTAPTPLDGQVGDLVSLLPWHGSVRGVTTTGLRFPLTDARLDAGSSRGVSNEFTADTASVAVSHGVLLAIQPGSP